MLIKKLYSKNFQKHLVWRVLQEIFRHHKDQLFHHLEILIKTLKVEKEPLLSENQINIPVQKNL